MNYKNESVFWLMNNRHKVANDMAKGNSHAMAAILLLLDQPAGAKAFKEMTTELTVAEWGKLYEVCAEEPSRLIPSVFVINSLVDGQLVHKNLALKYPAQFVIEPVKDFYESEGREKWRIKKRLREDFIRRYNEVKLCQR